MLRVHGSVTLTPLEKRVGALSNAGVDRLCVLRLPNDERVVLADASQELVIWRELQFQNLMLDTAKNRHWFPRLHIPQNDWCIGLLLEDCAFLAGGDDVARV